MALVGLSTVTFMDSCEGLAKRILNDLSKYSYQELKEFYEADINHGGGQYNNIMQLANLLHKLETEDK